MIFNPDQDTTIKLLKQDIRENRRNTKLDIIFGAAARTRTTLIHDLQNTETRKIRKEDSLERIHAAVTADGTRGHGAHEMGGAMITHVPRQAISLADDGAVYAGASVEQVCQTICDTVNERIAIWFVGVVRRGAMAG